MYHHINSSENSSPMRYRLRHCSLDVSGGVLKRHGQDFGQNYFSYCLQSFSKAFFIGNQNLSAIREVISDPRVTELTILFYKSFCLHF